MAVLILLKVLSLVLDLTSFSQSVKKALKSGVGH